MLWESKLRGIISRNPELQTWASHLEIRLPELARISEIAGDRELGDFIEIGCGNGLASAYFAPRARTVCATDLPDVDHSAHSIGLDRARRLFSVAGLSHAKVVGCSGDALPFPDASFDTVFSMHTLEHLPNRVQGVREALRVLRPGGRMIAAVPASAWSLIYPFGFYSEFGQRAFRRAFRSSNASNTSNESVEPSASLPTAQQPVVRDWRSFRKAYPHFPLPKPHGEFPSYFHELYSLRPGHWRKICEQGGFSRIRIEPISILPRALMTLLLGKTGLRLSEKLKPLDKKLCQVRALSSASQFICIVAEKT